MKGRTNRAVRYSKAPPDPIYAEIGARIHELRVVRGWTVEKLANMVGVQRGYFTLWEAGVRPIYAHRLIAIARALEVSLADLVPDDTEPVGYVLTASVAELAAMRRVAAGAERAS